MEREAGEDEVKPKLLDLFCGAGGAAAGYHRAGFDVTGVDIVDQPRYPFRFIKSCALSFPLDGFDVVHASPPCQLFSAASRVHRARGKEYPDCLTPIRFRLQSQSRPWVIENVVGAPLEPPCIILCGLMFSLPVFRHRVFQPSFPILTPPHPSHHGHKVGVDMFSVAGGAGRWKSWGVVKRNVTKGTAAQWRAAMGIDWMTRYELSQAIPPVYTEFIGKKLMEYLS